MEDAYRSQFRLPYPVYEKLKTAAEESGRSLNAELVYRLTQSFTENTPPSQKTASKASNIQVEELAEKLALPENRAELKAILAALTKLANK